MCWESGQPDPPTHGRAKVFKSWGSEALEPGKTQIFCPSGWVVGGWGTAQDNELGIIAFYHLFLF